MAKTPNPKDAPADFDALTQDQGEVTPAELSIAPDADNFEDLLASAEADSGNESVELTPAQKRIAELKAQLAQPLPEEADEPVFEDEPELTEEEREIKELEAQLAEREAKRLDREPVRFSAPAKEGILLHVVEDGFNQFGQIWFRGQEIVIDQAAYARTKDRHGNSWVDTLLPDPHAQYAAWGKVYVAPGPFVPRPGEVFNDSLAQEDERRRRGVPARSRD